MGFRLVPKSVTLNGLKQRNGHCQVTTTEIGKYQAGSIGLLGETF